AGLLETGEGDNLLLLDVHHLVVDGVSWRVLVGDLETACEQLQGGGEVRLAGATTSYKRWSELLEERARSLPTVETEWPEVGGRGGTVGGFRAQGAVAVGLEGDGVGSLRRMKGALHGIGERLLDLGLRGGLPEAEVSFNYLGQWDNLGSGASGGLIGLTEEG